MAKKKGNSDVQPDTVTETTVRKVTRKVDEDIRQAVREALEIYREPQDVDGWHQEAIAQDVTNIVLFKRHPKTGKPFRLTTLSADIDKVADFILGEWGPGSYSVKGYMGSDWRIVASLDFSLGTPDDPETTSPSQAGYVDLDPDIEVAKSLRQSRALQAKAALDGRPPDQLGTIKAVAEIMGTSKGNPEVAAIIQTQGAQVTELMRMLVQKKDEPGIGSKMLAAFAPALPGLLEAAAERFFGGGAEATITDASQMGKLDWGGWVKVALHQVISQNPELIQRVITSLAGSATGRPIQLPPMPGQPTEPQPAAEEAPMSQGQDPKMKQVRDHVIGRILAVGAAKAEEDRGPVLRSLVAFLESLDPQGSLGIAKLLDSLPDMDVEAATLRLSFFDERFADPGIKPGVEALIAYLREQVTEEPEPAAGE